jgi:predicted metalloprotease with PDZ domain
MKTLVRFFCAVVLASAMAATAAAGGVADKPLSIFYRLDATHPAEHLFDVTMEIADVDAPTIDVSMPAWSPGRYAIYDFAKNVQEFSARTRDGKPLAAVKTDKQTWRIATQGNRELVVAYRVFANNLSGTFSVLDERHGNFNGASIFAYVVGHKPDPVRLKLALPVGWRAMGGASETPDQTEFSFPNYDVLIDTPMELGKDFEVRSFDVDGRTYRVVVNQIGERSGVERLVEGVEKIVRAETAMYGPPDFKHYTFLFNFAPTRGDGMEHLNSTQIAVTGALRDEAALDDALGTAAHEFFHLWNVKRIRPIELGPWDYAREVHTRSLWIAEGITNYYGNLFMARAGIWTPERYYRHLDEFVGVQESRPGKTLMSLEQSSWDTWFFIGAPSAQQTNLQNVTINYYVKGELVGLLLDLEIRARTKGRKSLDDVFRRLYADFYEQPAATYYLKGKGYRPEDFLAAVNATAESDFTEFFAQYVSGVAPLDYNRALAAVGLRMEEKTAQGFTTRVIREAGDASDAQKRMREAWLRGR